MRMYNKLPHTITINNKEITVNTDYKVFVRFEIEMQGNDTKKAIQNVLSAFYPAFLLRHITNEMIDKFIWFYKCGKEEPIKKSGKGSNIRAFDYEIDDDLIYSAFMETYKIDLSNIDKIDAIPYESENKYSAAFYSKDDKLLYHYFMHKGPIDWSD